MGEKGDFVISQIGKIVKIYYWKKNSARNLRLPCFLKYRLICERRKHSDNGRKNVSFPFEHHFLLFQDTFSRGWEKDQRCGWEAFSLECVKENASMMKTY